MLIMKSKWLILIFLCSASLLLGGSLGYAKESTPGTHSASFTKSKGNTQEILSYYQDEKGNRQKIRTDLVDEADINTQKVPISEEVAQQIVAKKNNINKQENTKTADRTETPYRALQVPFDVTIPKDFTKGYSIGKYPDRMIFTPENASHSKGILQEKNKVMYRNVWKDTDVTLSVVNEGLKETLILKSLNSPKKYLYRVDGGITEKLESGQLSITPAWLKDARGKTRQVKQTLRHEVEGTFIELSVDTSNLMYPIYVDPTVTYINYTNTNGKFTVVNNGGTLWTWVQYPDTELGYPIKLMDSVKKVINSHNGGVILKSDGTVWVWGDSNFENSDTSLLPVQVPGLTSVTKVALNVNKNTIYVVKSDGTVWAWGNNELGQVGDGTILYRSTPVQIPELSNIEEIWATYDSVYVQKTDGTVWAWGNDFYSGLQSYSPIQISGLSSMTYITNGIALKSDGTVWVWGYHANTSKGMMSEELFAPAMVSNLSSVKEIVSAVGNGVGVVGEHIDPYTFAIKNDGTVWYWRGWLGDGSDINLQSVSNPQSIEKIVMSEIGRDIAVIDHDGDIYLWNPIDDYGYEHFELNYRLYNLPDVVDITPFSVTYNAPFGGVFAILQDGTIWKVDIDGKHQVDAFLPIQTLQYDMPIELTFPYLHGKAITVNVDYTAVHNGRDTLIISRLEGDINFYDITVYNETDNSFIEGEQINSDTQIMLSFDALAGNKYIFKFSTRSDNENTISIVVTNDLIAPTVSLTPSTTTQTKYPVSITVDATDNVKVTQMKWAEGNKPASYFISGGMELTESFIYVRNNGTYTVWARDAAGNGTVKTINIKNIDYTPPSVVLSTSINAPTNQPVTITVTSEDNVGVILTKWASGTQTSDYFATAGTVLSGNTFSVSVNGIYTVWVADAAGNQMTKTINVTNIDTTTPTAPTQLIITGTTSTSVTLGWTASTDNVGVTGYDIYNGTTLAGSVNGSTTSYKVTSLASNTLYNFTVKAKDAAGNVSAASNSLSIWLNGNLTYTYDTRGRLKTIMITSTGKIIKSFEYDNNGNLLSK